MSVIRIENKVACRAPMRVDLLGTPTDIPHFANLYPGCIMNVAIDRYVTVEVRETRGEVSRVRVEGKEDYGDEFRGYSPALTGTTRLVAAVKEFLGYGAAVEAIVSYDLLPGGGLGSSAAVLVASLQAFRSLASRDIFSPTELARLAHDIEFEMVGNYCGWQDHIAAAFGGTNLIQGQRGRVARRWVEGDTWRGLEFYIVGPMERQRSGATLLELAARVEAGDVEVIELLSRMSQLAVQGWAWLEEGHTDACMALVREQLELMRAIGEIVVPQRLLDFISALEGLCLAAKPCGAGGGGYILVVSRQGERQCIDKLHMHHYDAMRVACDLLGCITVEEFGSG